MTPINTAPRADDSDLAARRESMLDILGSWDLEGARPDAAGMKIVEDYVEGRIELDEMIKLMTDPNV